MQALNSPIYFSECSRWVTLRESPRLQNNGVPLIPDATIEVGQLAELFRLQQ